MIQSDQVQLFSHLVKALWKAAAHCKGNSQDCLARDLAGRCNGFPHFLVDPFAQKIPILDLCNEDFPSSVLCDWITVKTSEMAKATQLFLAPFLNFLFAALLLGRFWQCELHKPYRPCRLDSMIGPQRHLTGGGPKGIKGHIGGPK